jgi:hypothetical protein
MAMSKRSGPFYELFNEVLEGAGFDEFVEGLCARFYHPRLGWPSLMPGVYFRALLEIRGKEVLPLNAVGGRVISREA